MTERETQLWWEGTDLYWELPFYADAGMCCEGLDRDNELCGREQLWAVREWGEEPGLWPVVDATMIEIRDAFAGNEIKGEGTENE